MTRVLKLSGLNDEAGNGVAHQVAIHRKLGWSQIEVRSIDGRPIAELGSAALLDLTRRIAAAGLSVPVVASRIGNWARPITAPFDEDLAELEGATTVARGLGAGYIRIMSYPNDGLPERRWRKEALRRIRDLTRRAEAAGVVLLLENCAGWAARDSGFALDLLHEIDSPAVGILFDIGNPVVYGYDGVAYLEAVLEHVHHIHVKDALISNRTGSPEFTSPGDGHARVRKCLRLAVAAGYSGSLSIEPEVVQALHLGRHASDRELGASYLAYARQFEQLLDETFAEAELRQGELCLPSQGAVV